MKPVFITILMLFTTSAFAQSRADTIEWLEEKLQKTNYSGGTYEHHRDYRSDRIIYSYRSREDSTRRRYYIVYANIRDITLIHPNRLKIIGNSSSAFGYQVNGRPTVVKKEVIIPLAARSKEEAEAILKAFRHLTISYLMPSCLED